MTKERSPLNPAREDARLAFQQGLALSELMALFAFFITETPEGAKVRQELETDWQEACTLLKKDHLLSGNQMSCREWFLSLKNQLAPEKKHFGAASSDKKVTPKANKRPAQKFRNT